MSVVPSVLWEFDDDNFVGPKHAFRRGFELLGFVVGEDIG